jgi:hypothetical protein
MSIGVDDFKFDTLEIRISNPDDLYFKLAFMDDADQSYIQSKEFRADSSAWQMRDAIGKFYTDKYHIWPEVTVAFFDADGQETTKGASDLDQAVYTVTVPKALSEASVTSILPLNVNSTATIDFVYPTDKQLSDPPMTGKFYARCADVDGQMYATRDMDLWISAHGF